MLYVLGKEEILDFLKTGLECRKKVLSQDQYYPFAFNSEHQVIFFKNQLVEWCLVFLLHAFWVLFNLRKKFSNITACAFLDFLEKISQCYESYAIGETPGYHTEPLIWVMCDLTARDGSLGRYRESQKERVQHGFWKNIYS